MAADSAAQKVAAAAEAKAAEMKAAEVPKVEPPNAAEAPKVAEVPKETEPTEAVEVPKAEPPKTAAVAARPVQIAVPAIVAAAPKVVAPKPAEIPKVELPKVAVETARPEPVPAPIGDSDLPLSLGKELLLEGFKATTPLVGSWSIKNGIARQTDPEAFYAKLAIPLVQKKRTFSYSFTAQSKARGRGWVGVGFHMFTPRSYTQKGFGAGDSLCIWLTRDPVHYKKNITRLQLYRSVDDWNMDLLDEVPVSESIFDANHFAVTVDPVEGSLDEWEREVGRQIHQETARWGFRSFQGIG